MTGTELPTFRRYQSLFICYVYLASKPFSDRLNGCHGPPAMTASISHVSRGTFVMFLQPLAVTSYKRRKGNCKYKRNKSTNSNPNCIITTDVAQT